MEEYPYWGIGFRVKRFRDLGFRDMGIWGIGFRVKRFRDLGLRV